MSEIWKTVDGFEGRYEVSSFGNVRSLNYHREGRTRILKPGKDHNGYQVVHLCKDGHTKHFQVHRLVAEAFIPNPGNLPQVNHKNEDKTDNQVNNLEWCSPAYNNNYGTRNERATKTQLNDPIKSKPVIQYDKAGVLVKKWPSAMEVERQNGWDQSHISSCCLGKLKTSYGFVWRFA